jgi:hypothetical protein
MHHRVIPSFAERISTWAGRADGAGTSASVNSIPQYSLVNPASISLCNPTASQEPMVMTEKGSDRHWWTG